MDLSRVQQPMIFIKEVVTKYYRVHVALDHLAAIERYDESTTEGDDKSLYCRLDALPGVDDTDYGGACGTHVLFTLQAEHDTPETWEKIEAALVAVIEGGSR